MRGGAAHFARQTHPSRAPRGEGRIPFELSLKYTAFWYNIYMRKVQIILLVLIVIGLALLFTQKYWLATFVNFLLDKGF